MTHPGDFTDTTTEQSLATAQSTPWEQPVREVSLSARADTVTDMATAWQTYLTHMTTIADQFRDIWKHELSETWSGPAADACHSKWVAIAGDFFAFVRNYGASGSSGAGVPGLLRDTAAAIHDAIGTIPIPVFGSSTLNDPSVAVLPNNRGVSKTGGTAWGDQLYADYQAGPGSYQNYAFLKIAQSAAEKHGKATYSHVPAGSRLRSSPNAQYDTGDSSHQVTTNYQDRGDQAAYDDQVQAWYISNQRLAYTSYNNLLNTYARHQTAVPGVVLRVQGPSTSTATPPRWTGPTGADATGTGTAFTGTGAASALPGASHPNAALPTSGSASVPGTTPGESSGLSGIGTSTPTSASNPGLGSVSEQSLGSGTSGGEGSVPGVGFFPGSGALPGEGAGVGPDPLNRTAAGTGIAGEGLSAIRNPANSSGLGMMGPGYGGTAGQDRDESRSWLTEDQDIWGLNDKPDMTPPDGII